MASSFKLRYNVSVTPVEEVTLADGSDVSYNINSNVDKILGGSSSRTIGSTAALVKYKSSYTTTTSGVALSDATILNNATIFTLLFIKIISAGSTGTPTGRYFYRFRGYISTSVVGGRRLSFITRWFG